MDRLNYYYIQFIGLLQAELKERFTEEELYIDDEKIHAKILGYLRSRVGYWENKNDEFLESLINDADRCEALEIFHECYKTNNPPTAGG